MEVWAWHWQRKHLKMHWVVEGKLVLVRVGEIEQRKARWRDCLRENQEVFHQVQELVVVVVEQVVLAGWDILEEQEEGEEEVCHKHSHSSLVAAQRGEPWRGRQLRIIQHEDQR